MLTTASAARRLGGNSRELGPWQHADLPRPDGGTLRVTRTPARHGPDGTGHLTGEVAGFVLSATNVPSVYVSGDNASLDVVRAVAGRLGPVDVALLFAAPPSFRRRPTGVAVDPARAWTQYHCPCTHPIRASLVAAAGLILSGIDKPYADQQTVASRPDTAGHCRRPPLLLLSTQKPSGPGASSPG